MQTVKIPATLSVPLKIDTKSLVHRSTGDLQSFLLSELSNAANLQAELEGFLASPRLARDVRRARKAKYGTLSAYRYSLLDQAIQRLCTVRLTQWILNGGLEDIRKSILESPNTSETLLADVCEQIRNYGRSPEEIAALTEWRQRANENPGAARVAAAVRYQERNIAEGKCCVCPQPLDRNSVRLCTRHLEIDRLRKPPKGGHGRQPGSLKVLALQREKQMCTTPEQRALWDRVAKQLGMSAVHVRNVATGVKHSDKVAAALLAAVNGN
jgi:DNA repair exonuclease SbcCD ATPase subunit